MRNNIETLIENHYMSCIKRNPNYKYSRDEHSAYWKHLFRDDNKYREYAIEFIIGSTYANNNGYEHHPV